MNCRRYPALLFMFFLIAWAGSTPLKAQDSIPEDLHKYFEDGGLSHRKNLVSTDFLAPITGSVALRFEHAFTKRFSVELGVYKLLPIYVFELLLPIGTFYSDFDPKSGFGFSIAPHYFFDSHAPERHFMGPRYAWRRHSLQNGDKLTVQDYTVNYGINLFVDKRIIFCYGMGVGYRRMLMDRTTSGNLFYGSLIEKKGILYMQWILGLGLLF